LGAIAASVVACVAGASAATTNATFTASCHSFSALAGASTNAGDTNRTIHFTGPGGFGGFPLIQSQADGSWLFSSEFKPVDWEPLIYVANYAISESVTNLVEYGLVTLSLPLTDEDGNGLPDILQLDQPGSTVVTGSWVRNFPAMELASLSGNIERKAGEKTGRYTFCISNSMGSTTITGAMRLHVLTGPVTFSRAVPSVCINADWTDLQGNTTNLTVCCSGDCLWIDNVDTVQMTGLFFGDDLWQRGIELDPIFMRQGSVYRAHGNFTGALETYWDDYSERTVEIVAPQDSDTNGVPDFSDFVPGAPYIARQPTSLKAIEGADIQLSVEARGIEPLSYQWRLNGSSLTDATNAVLSLPGVGTNSAGSYSVIISNAPGRAVSIDAVLEVVSPLVGPVTLDWVKYYVGAGKLKVDSQGKLIVGGVDKLEPSGDVIWSREPQTAADFVLDETDNIYITGSLAFPGGGSDIVTIKYDPLGQVVWSNYYASTVSLDARAAAIARDGMGNTFVGGALFDNGFAFQYIVVKYDAAGLEAWRQGYVTECSSFGLLGFAVSLTGETYEAGWAGIVKWDGDGNLIWLAGCTNGRPIGLRLDPSGDVIVGSFFEAESALAKLTPEGQSLWEQRWPNNQNSYLAQLEVDANGQIYVVDSGSALRTFGPDGKTGWSASGIGVLAFDAAGNIYSAGSVRTNTSTRDTDILTKKLDPQGNELWSARYGGSDTDTANAIAVDAEGAVYVQGTLARDFPVVIKYLQADLGATVRPASQEASVGSTVVFNGFFRGSPPRSYQWQFQNQDISGATSATLILEDIQASDAGEYRVIITDGQGVETSMFGRLTVLPARATRFRLGADLSFDAEPGAYWIETSTDLKQWTKYQMLQYVPPQFLSLPPYTRPQLFMRAVRRP